MIRVTIEEIDQPASDDMIFGDDQLVIRYKGKGERSYQKRGAGSDPLSARVMLDRATDSVMRMAYPEAHESKQVGGTD